MAKRMIKPLVLVTAGKVDAADIRRMRAAGYLVVVVEHLLHVRIEAPPPVIEVDGLGGIALAVLMDNGVMNCDVRDVFRKRVVRAAAAQQEPTVQPPQERDDGPAH